MYTKTINEIYVDANYFNGLVNNYKEKLVCKALQKDFNNLKSRLNNILKKEWIRIKNKNVFFIVSENLIIADSERMCCSRKGFLNSIDGIKARPISYEEAERIFIEKRKNNPLITTDFRIKDKNDNFPQTVYIGAKDSNSYYYFNIRDKDEEEYTSYKYFIKDTDVIKISVCDTDKNKSILENFILFNLIPIGLDKKNEELLKILFDLYGKNKIIITNEKVEITQNFSKEINKKLYNGVHYEVLNEDEIKEKILKGNFNIEDDLKSKLLLKLLNCEKIRADIEPYNIKRLEDPNLGHWDLWTKEEKNNEYKIKTDMNFVARNPLCDIKEDGIIGIDFGTKSTIVVYQDGDDNTQPMRVGIGNYSKKVQSRDFENPTVMEFINLEEFLKRYNAKEGRPDTLWEHLTVSHTAFNSLFEGKSDDYYSYFYDLKQWADDKNRQIRIRDKKGNEKVLPAFVDINENDFNPIELYAYYIGLYINNMHNGIYLYYMMSFPVTYEKKIREKIIRSFERGIKKSLPIEVLNDEQAMKKFRVIHGASEPAAYAICALQEYGFDPQDDEEVFYGIFDFGGGTTDFDFGIWKSDDEDYDYIINHFGAGGDKYLGGENILELLSFEVFKENQDTLRNEGISFLKPIECKKFAGSEVLISDSQEAKLNMKQLMEKLRPLWEQHENYEKNYESGIIKVNLFDKNGQPKMNFELNVDAEHLKNLIYERIEKGVKNFFEALKLTFKFDNTKSADKVIIFLAGNSSKCELVTEIFNKYIAEYTKDINGDEKSDKEYFVLYPPLGTPESVEIQKKKGIYVDEDDITKPTGKTGVAFGLIDGRPGSMINVISEKKQNEEIKFNYYIGLNSKKMFKVIIDRNVQYNEWIRFKHAKISDFEIYYTNLPEATTNKLNIKEVSKKMCRTDVVNENASIYVRTVSPSEIEYVVADSKNISNNKYLGQIHKIELN